MTGVLGAKPVIDTTDFKSGIAKMNADLRVLESGFRASTASMGNWAESGSGLEARIKSLNSQMDVQRDKVAALKGEYERIKAEKGEDAAATKNAEVAYNKSVETLGKMESELRETEGALVEMESSTEDAGEAAEETSGKWEGLKSVLSGLGSAIKGTVAVVLGLAAAVTAVAAAVGGLVFSTAASSAELVDLSTKTGISTTRLQELSYIGGQVGTSLDTITGSQARLIRSMSGAQDQIGKYNEKMAEAEKSDWDNLEEGDVILGDMAQAFQTLGISVTDSTGQLRDNETVFAETIDALGKIQNPAERDALAMQLFGKSAQELNPLIKAGSEELANMADEAHLVGAVMSEEDVAAFEAFDDTLASLKAGLKGTLGTLAGAFLPGFQSVFAQMFGYLQDFSGIVSGADGDFGKMADGITGLVTQIATDIAAQAPQMLKAGLAIVKSILTAITSALPSMLAAGIEIIKSLIGFIVQNLPMLIDAGIQIIMMLVNALVENLPMLVEAALQAIIALANGLAAALPTLIPAVVQAIITIVQTLLENIPMLVEAALALILGLADGLVAAIPILIPAIPQIIEAIFNAMILSLPKIGQAAVQLVMTLLTGIIGALPELGKAAVQIIEALVKGIVNHQKALWQTGRDIVVGIWDGIESQANWFYQKIKDFFAGIVEAVESALGISSPSRVMFVEGVNTIKGFGLGAQAEFQNMERQLVMAFRGVALAPAMAGASAQTNIQNESFQFFAPTFIGDTTAGSLGESLKGKRY